MAITVKLGFVPLIDCAIPVVAADMGFAAAEGIDLALERESSWASLRDKLAFGLIDAAHILAPLPLAMHLGLAGIPPVAMAVPMALGRGGNGITISSDLYDRMQAADPAAMEQPGLGTATALRKVILADRAAGRPLLSFASVFPFSCHHYELRRWLLAGGINPATEVNLGIIAPPRMAESLGAGWIDGYCVGEPWNTRAVMRGIGKLIAAKEDIWPNSHEKVLGLRQRWLADNHDLTLSLIRALTRAAIWADATENRQALVALLAEPRHLGLPMEIIAAALAQTATAPLFHRDGATLPRPNIAREIMAEMMAAGQLAHPIADADGVWRPDIHQAAFSH